ncbi:carboxymuconolactone decarboxylase family protein [Mycobacterium sp. MMS18-G62]
MSVTTLTVHAEQRRRQGLALYREIMAVEPVEPATARAATLIDFVFAEIWSRPGLQLRDRRLIALTCAAGADAHTSVSDHFYAALKTGQFTLDELDEFILHFAVYCGWPKAQTTESILDQQLTRLADEGATLAPRRCPQPLSAAPADQELRKQGGEKEFRDVNCCPAPPRDVPYYDNGILNFVFGEMWKRPGLNRRDRRWITLAAVGLDDTITPIQSHVYSAMKSGDITYDEMREMVLHFAAHSGWPKAQYMQQSVDEMHERIKDEASVGPKGEGNV